MSRRNPVPIKTRKKDLVERIMDMTGMKQIEAIDESIESFFKIVKSKKNGER